MKLLAVIITDAMLADVKNYLDITWTDEDMDKKLKGIIERGIKYLENIAGETLIFDQENNNKSLLLDYCRYARSNALEMFRVNFKSELIAIRLQTKASKVILSENQTNP